MQAPARPGAGTPWEKQQGKARKLPPLVTFRGKGMTDEFKKAGWEKIRDEIYRGQGA